MIDVSTRISLYWAGSGAVFLAFAIIALRRWSRRRTRGRLSIIVFMLTWSALCIEAFMIRIGWIFHPNPTDRWSETIRAVGFLSLVWMAVEFEIRSIAIHRYEDDEDLADAVERAAANLKESVNESQIAVVKLTQEAEEAADKILRTAENVAERLRVGSDRTSERSVSAAERTADATERIADVSEMQITEPPREAL